MTVKEFSKTKLYKEFLKDVRALSGDPTAKPNIGLYIVTATQEEKNEAARECGYPDWKTATAKK